MRGLLSRNSRRAECNEVRTVCWKVPVLTVACVHYPAACQRSVLLCLSLCVNGIFTTANSCWFALVRLCPSSLPTLAQLKTVPSSPAPSSISCRRTRCHSSTSRWLPNPHPRDSCKGRFEQHACVPASVCCLSICDTCISKGRLGQDLVCDGVVLQGPQHHTPRPLAQFHAACAQPLARRPAGGATVTPVSMGRSQQASC